MYLTTAYIVTYHKVTLLNIIAVRINIISVIILCKGEVHAVNSIYCGFKFF